MKIVINSDPESNVDGDALFHRDAEFRTGRDLLAIVNSKSAARAPERRAAGVRGAPGVRHYACADST